MNKRFERNRRFAAVVFLAVLFKMERLSIAGVWHSARMLARALFARRGKVDRAIWFRRMRHCYKCPVFVRGGLSCGSPLVNIETGCGCYVPLLATLPEATCWANHETDLDIGWPQELEFHAKPE